jgi:phosphatidylglycerophosphatase A
MFLAGFFGLGGWEIILILAVLLILFGAMKFPELVKGMGQGFAEFKKAVQEVLDEITRNHPPHHPDYRGDPKLPEKGKRITFGLWVAQGFGVGWIPFAPGTFGSLLGLVWFATLVTTGSFWAYVAGAIEGIAFSIWLCDDAEKILGETDPGSVVLDEIIAIPFCFLPWIACEWWRHDALPDVSYFFSGRALWMTLGIVALFRVFDIWKPWPVRQVQRLPGGWGVTVDDLLAAIYVALISIVFVR